MPSRNLAPSHAGNIQLNCLTFNPYPIDKFLERKCFQSEVENIFLGPYTAGQEKQKAAISINWMGCDGSELVNSWKTATRNTAKESLNNLCDAVE